MTGMAPPAPVLMGDVVRRVLAEQAAELRRQRKPARRGESDGVHQMRVATRRLRAALRVFQDVLDRPGKTRRRLRRLARRLGAVRDCDVMALLLKAQLREPLDEGQRRRLGALLRFVRAARARKHGRLSRRLARARQRGLRERLERLTVRDGDASEELATIGLARAVARLGDDVAREAAMHELAPPPPALHRLRIAIKRLRYALEFHAAAGGLAFDAELAAARELQDVLGELHDIDVLRAALKEGRGPFAGPWPTVSRRLSGARRERLAHFAELRERWLALTHGEPATTPSEVAFPSLEAAPVQLRLVTGKQIASTQIG